MEGEWIEPNPGLVDEYRASWALIRQWAGQDAAIAQRAAQIERLERLVWDAIYARQKAGLDDQAHRLPMGAWEKPELVSWAGPERY